MSSLIHQLNNESLLLMYLADELEAEDRADVERMLASDGGLREQLEQVRAAYDGAQDVLRAADGHERLAVPAGAAARRVGQAARAWHARRISEAAAPHARQKWRIPWWAYPVGAAAAIVLVAVSLWWHYADQGPFRLGGEPVAIVLDDPDDSDSDTDDLAAASLVTGPLDGYYPALAEADSELDEVEEELYALLEPGKSPGIFNLDETDAQ